LNITSTITQLVLFTNFDFKFLSITELVSLLSVVLVLLLF